MRRLLAADLHYSLPQFDWVREVEAISMSPFSLATTWTWPRLLIFERKARSSRITRQEITTSMQEIRLERKYRDGSWTLAVTVCLVMATHSSYPLRSWRDVLFVRRIVRSNRRYSALFSRCASSLAIRNPISGSDRKKLCASSNTWTRAADRAVMVTGCGRSMMPTFHRLSRQAGGSRRLPLEISSSPSTNT
jgi:hypothetical protein